MAKQHGLPTTRRIATSLPNDERIAYIALALSPGLGSRRLAALLSRFGSSLNVFAALRRPPPDLSRFELEALRIAVAASVTRAESVVGACAAIDTAVVVPSDGAFPVRLRSIPDPPVLLYARGNLALCEPRAVAIVGSRDHTRYGQETAALLAGACARAGIVVVSGMARGLDAVAHAAALDADGDTIGVLGTGVDVTYPVTNRELYQRVIERGLLLSESAPGEHPHGGAFPRRNRLISGLADVLVVVEAKLGSGTMITVSAALEQGREVMAVPGNVSSPTSVGTNQLLRDGAEPILTEADLLAKFGASTGPVARNPVPPCSLSPDEARVLDELTAEPRHVDDVAERTGLPIGMVLGVLCGLELGGLVVQEAGSNFRRQSRREA